MSSGLLPGYVLHSSALSDHKLILDMVVAEHGHIRLVARRPAKRSGALQWQPFGRHQLSWRGQQSLKTVQVLEAETTAMALQGVYLFSGLYLNELTMRAFAADHICPALFPLYERTLTALWQAQQIDTGLSPLLEVILRQYEFAILAELGTRPQFALDGIGQPIAADGYYQWWPEQGFLPYVMTSSIANIEGWRGADLIAIAAALADHSAWQSASLKAAKRLCRTLLQFYIGTKPLLSRQLFKAT